MAGKNVVRQDVVEISFDVLDDPVQKVSKSADKMKTSVTAATGKAESGLQKLSGPAQAAAGEILKIGTAADTASGKLSRIGDSLQNFGGKLDGLGSQLTAKLTVPLTAAATAATKLYTDAETSYAKVSTIADETVLSYDKLKAGITKTSKDTGVAVTDLNEALYQSLSAGVDSGNAIGFTTDMVKLAKGGFTSVEKSVDVVTSALNAYGMSADQAVSVSDKLVTTQNVGKTTVDQLASNLGRVIPTAKAFNVGIDDTCAAMADLTKNGIATAESTTYFNSMLNELGASGTVADKTLRELTGLGFTQLLNEGKSMTEVLDLLETRAEGSGKKLSDMFGSQEAGKAALTIMKDGGVEYNSILKQMQDSAGATQGAFEKMDSTPAAKFQKEMNKLKLAGIDAGEKLLPVVTKLVEFIGDAAEKFSGMSDKQQGDLLGFGGMVAAAGPALKVIGSVTKGVGGIAKSLGSGKGVLGLLGKLPGPLKIVGLAAGATGLAFKLMHEKAASDSLKDHFGDIKLSMEECEDVAKRLTTNDWTMKLDAVVDAKAEMDEIEASLESTVREIEKTGWKVGIGLELTEEETGAFKDNIKTFVDESLELFNQNQYTATLAINATLTPGTNAHTVLSDFTKKFQEETGGEMTKLGDELAKLTNDALADGILSPEEYDMIDAKRKELEAYTAKWADIESKGNLAKIKMRAPKMGLDSESFSEVSRLTTEQIQQNLDNAEVSLTMTLGQLGLKYPEGGVEYDKLVNEILLDDAKNRGTYVLEGLQVDLGTLETNFEKPLGKFEANIDSELSKLIGNVKGSYGQLDGLGQNFQTVLVNSMAGLDFGDRGKNGAIDQMMEYVTPKMAELEKIADTYYQAGQIPPKSIVEGLAQGYKLEAAAGQLDEANIWKLLASEVAGDKGYQEALANDIEQGAGQLPIKLASALASNYGVIYDAAKGQFETINEASVVSMGRTRGLLYSLIGDLAGDQGQMMVDSIMEQTPAVRVQAMMLFSQLSTAAAEEKPAIAATLSGMGLELSDELLSSMGLKMSSDNQLVDAATGKAVEAVEKMSATTGAGALTGPKMGEITGVESAAETAVQKIQSYFNGSYIVAPVHVDPVGSGVSPDENAAGDFVQHKTLSYLAEDGYGEFVISTDPGRRTRSLGLLNMAAEKLNARELLGGPRSVPKPEIGYTPSRATAGSSRSYVDNSQYSPMFVANFGSGTATDREMEKKMRAWLFNALEDYAAREGRRNPAVLEV